MNLKWVEKTGQAVLDVVSEVGTMAIFLVQVLYRAFRPPFRAKLFWAQAEFVGVGSLFIIFLTGSFTGAVFTLQSIDALAKVGMENMVGSTVMLAVTRELGPVLTSLMVTGRVASSMATELGTMRVSEQIDAIEVMAVDSVQYLVAPRMIAGIIMVPALLIIFDALSYWGSYAVAVGLSGIDEGAFQSRIQWYLDPSDVVHGIIKASVFGLVLTLVGCYKGFYAKGGARGVGIATTQAVVIGSISTFVLDYILTALLLGLGL